MKQIYKIANECFVTTSGDNLGISKDVYAKFRFIPISNQNRNFTHKPWGQLQKFLESELDIEVMHA